MKLTLPEGWTAEPTSVDATAGTFTATGPLDRLYNVLTLSANQNGATTTAAIKIPAAWVVSVGNFGREGWYNDNGSKFDSAKGRLPVDENLSKGIGFGKPVVVTPSEPWHKQIAWQRYIASVDFPGGADPGSVDLSAVDYFGVFDVAYGARWIHSPTERSIPLTFDSHTFAGDYNLTLWVNGQVIRDTTDRKGTAAMNLKQGWNAIVFKSNHMEWQWQFDMTIVEQPGVDLSDLRFSIVPRS